MVTLTTFFQSAEKISAFQKRYFVRTSNGFFNETCTYMYLLFVRILLQLGIAIPMYLWNIQQEKNLMVCLRFEYHFYKFKCG